MSVSYDDSTFLQTYIEDEISEYDSTASAGGDSRCISFCAATCGDSGTCAAPSCRLGFRERTGAEPLLSCTPCGCHAAEEARRRSHCGLHCPKCALNLRREERTRAIDLNRAYAPFVVDREQGSISPRHPHVTEQIFTIHVKCSKWAGTSESGSAGTISGTVRLSRAGSDLCPCTPSCSHSGVSLCVGPCSPRKNTGSVAITAAQNADKNSGERTEASCSARQLHKSISGMDNSIGGGGSDSDSGGSTAIRKTGGPPSPSRAVRNTKAGRLARHAAGAPSLGILRVRGARARPDLRQVELLQHLGLL